MAGYDSTWLTSFGLGVVSAMRATIADIALDFFGTTYDALLSKRDVKEILSFDLWKDFPYREKYIGNGYLVYWDVSGSQLTVSTKNVKGKLDSVWDLPAIIVYNKTTGRVLRQEWYRDGVRHRENGPAVIKTSSPGNTRVVYYKNGKKEGIAHSMAETAAPAA